MKRILVIDDETGIRNVLRDILEDEGYQVALAEDGFKGLEILENKNIDLVFLDVWLPNKGGIDVLKEIKEHYPEIETIVISGHASISLAVQAVKMGAFDYLVKPVKDKKMLSTIEKALADKPIEKRKIPLLKQPSRKEDMFYGLVGNSRNSREIS